MSIRPKRPLQDTGTERALLGSIIKYGRDAFIDADQIVCSNDFSLPLNRTIYTCIQVLAENDSCEVFDIESIKAKAAALGINAFSSERELEYLDLLKDSYFDKTNIPIMAMQIKKYSTVRDLYGRYCDATDYLSNISGNETLSEIIQNAEGKIVDFVSGVEGANSLEKLTDNLNEYIDYLIEKPSVDQLGIPSGFPLYDDAIGGGLRRGSLTVKASRSKVGKSWDALNVALNVAKLKIPILYLDTELTSDYQRNRMLCIHSQCPIQAFETGRFKENRELRSQVIEAAKEIKEFPFYYENISGMTHTEALAIARRWIVKHVGFNNEGKANDCLIIYDYIKLTNSDNISKALMEYQLLGFICTELHNFSVKYSVPILAYNQLNRDGIDGEDTSVIAGSDRILWLCSSMTLIKNKDENDISMGCDYSYGNKKLVILDTRHGPGLELGDYINVHASIRPGVNKNEACGLFREGLLFSQIATNTNINVYKDKNDRSGNNK